MPVTRSSLCADVARLGVARGDLLMVHASVRSLGPITGGVNTLIHALFDAIGAEGTLSAYVDFEPFFEEGDAEIPVFDKRIAPAARDHGILHEAIRNWPGALRSDHPDAGVVAIGPKAEWLVAEHPFQYGYGEGSPFFKFMEDGGRVLMLGAPLDTITLLHTAEHLAQIPDKRIVRYRRLMPVAGGAEWVEFEEFDTSHPVHDGLPENVFELIAESFLEEGRGRRGLVGQANSALFDGRELVRFGVEWMERAINNRSR